MATKNSATDQAKSTIANPKAHSAAKGRRSSRPVHPLVPGRKQDVVIEHETFEAISYDFYFPIAIWYHTAARTFIQFLGLLAPGATVFKGATGVWKPSPDEDSLDAMPAAIEEDVYVYRLILRASEASSARNRPLLEAAIATMMASLSEWTESSQDAFLFTESQIVMNLATLARSKAGPSGAKDAGKLRRIPRP